MTYNLFKSQSVNPVQEICMFTRTEPWRTGPLQGETLWMTHGRGTDRRGPSRQHEGVKPARQQEWCSPKRLLFHQVLRWLANVTVLCQLTEVRGDIIQLRHVEWGERVVPFYILARFFTSWCKKQIFFSGEILIIFSFLLYFQSKLKYGFYV